MAVILDIMLFDFAASLLLNMMWWVTSVASVFNKASTYYYFIYIVDIQGNQIIYPLVLGWLI